MIIENQFLFPSPFPDSSESDSDTETEATSSDSPTSSNNSSLTSDSDSSDSDLTEQFRKKLKRKKKKRLEREHKRSQHRKKQKRHRQRITMDEFILPAKDVQSRREEQQSSSDNVTTPQDQQQGLQLDSNMNNFMGHQHDDTHYCDLVDLEGMDIEKVTGGNSRLLEFLQLEGRKLFCSMFLNRRRLRDLENKKKKKSRRDYDDSGSDEEEDRKDNELNPWKRHAQKKKDSQLSKLTPAEVYQFRQFPHMPRHAYSLGSGLFVSSMGYKPYPNAEMHIKLGRLSFTNQDPNQGESNSSNSLFNSTGNPQLDALFEKKRKRGTTELSKINAYSSQIPMSAIPSLILCLSDVYKKHLTTCEELNLPADVKTGIEKPDEEFLPPIQYIR